MVKVVKRARLKLMNIMVKLHKNQFVVLEYKYFVMYVLRWGYAYGWKTFSFLRLVQ